MMKTCYIPVELFDWSAGCFLVGTAPTAGLSQKFPTQSITVTLTDPKGPALHLQDEEGELGL